jgi:hypothetical protein
MAKFNRYAEETNMDKEKSAELTKTKKMARQWAISNPDEYGKLLDDAERKFRNERPDWNPETVRRTAKAYAMGEIGKRLLNKSK